MPEIYESQDHSSFTEFMINQYTYLSVCEQKYSKLDKNFHGMLNVCVSSLADFLSKKFPRIKSRIYSSYANKVSESY